MIAFKLKEFNKNYSDFLKKSVKKYEDMLMNKQMERNFNRQ